MKQRLEKLLGVKITSVEKLFGDASYRAYFRAKAANGETFVVMEMPEGKMSASEEITNLKTKPVEPPFLNVQKYLKKIGLPVPEVKLFSPEDRWIILEDLGDTKLADVWTVEWYKKAIDLLVAMQKKTKTADPNCLAFQRSFDETLLNWEFDHFWEYQAAKGDRDFFVTTTRKITKELLKLPQVFVHRDFQSRNLMVKNNHLYLIDFQDALLGPKPYDLVALLRDSYVDLTQHLDTLIAYYCEQSGEDFKKFRRSFDLQTVQRKMKDAGRFVYIDKVKKNPNFLQYIPASLKYVRDALGRLSEYKGLLEFLP